MYKNRKLNIRLSKEKRDIDTSRKRILKFENTKEFVTRKCSFLQLQINNESSLLPTKDVFKVQSQFSLGKIYMRPAWLAGLDLTKVKGAQLVGSGEGAAGRHTTQPRPLA